MGTNPNRHRWIFSCLTSNGAGVERGWHHGLHWVQHVEPLRMRITSESGVHIRLL